MCKTPEQEQYSSGRTWYHVQMDWGLHLLPTPLLSAPTHNKLGRHPPISVPQKKKKKKGGGLKNQYHYLDPSVKWGHSKNSHQNLPNSMCVCAKSLQLCLTLCDPMDCSPPGSSVHGIGEWTRILEWVAMLSFRGSSRPHQRLLNLLHCGGFMTTRDR